MTGSAFLRFINKRGIPLSCAASKLNCKLSTLQSLKTKQTVPRYYIDKFVEAFKAQLKEDELSELHA